MKLQRGHTGGRILTNTSQNSDGRPCAPGAVGLVSSRRDPRWEDGDTPWIELGDVGWLTPEGELFMVGRAADLDIPEGKAVPRVSPVHEAEHLLRLEWDADDAAAVMLETGAERSQLIVATVGCQDADADALESILRSRDLDYVVRIVLVPSIPRSFSGEVNRAKLKALLARA